MADNNTLRHFYQTQWAMLFRWSFANPAENVLAVDPVVSATYINGHGFSVLKSDLDWNNGGGKRPATWFDWNVKTRVEWERKKD